MKSSNDEKDILDPETFSHFIDCKRCGWSFSPSHFDEHNCDEYLNPKPSHSILCTKDKCADGCGIANMN